MKGGGRLKEHVPLLHNSTSMNVHETPCLRTFKIFTIQKLYTQTQYCDRCEVEPPDHKRETKDDPLSFPELFLTVTPKDTPGPIQLRPWYLRNIFRSISYY